MKGVTLDRYGNGPDGLGDLCLADFASSYISEKAVDIKVESKDVGNYTDPVSDLCEIPLCKKVIKLKISLGESRKSICLCVIRVNGY